MGWNHKHDPDGLHEGFAVAVVNRDGLFRELCYPDAEARNDIVVAQAGCDCGWRSPRVPVAASRFRPFVLLLSDADEQRIVQLWERHVEAELG